MEAQGRHYALGLGVIESLAPSEHISVKSIINPRQGPMALEKLIASPSGWTTMEDKARLKLRLVDFSIDGNSIFATDLLSAAREGFERDSVMDKLTRVEWSLINEYAPPEYDFRRVSRERYTVIAEPGDEVIATLYNDGTEPIETLAVAVMFRSFQVPPSVSDEELRESLRIPDPEGQCGGFEITGPLEPDEIAGPLESNDLGELKDFLGHILKMGENKDITDTNILQAVERLELQISKLSETLFSLQEDIRETRDAFLLRALMDMNASLLESSRIPLSHLQRVMLQLMDRSTLGLLDLTMSRPFSEHGQEIHDTIKGVLREDDSNE